MTIESEDIETEVNLGENQDEWIVSESVDKYAAPILVILSAGLTWVTVSAPFIGTITATGFSMDLGRIAAFFAFVFIGATVVLSEKWKGLVHFYGGMLIAVIGIYQYLEVSNTKREVVSSIATDSTFGENLASTVVVNTGIGVWIAIFSGVAMVYIGFHRRRQTNREN